MELLGPGVKLTEPARHGTITEQPAVANLTLLASGRYAENEYILGIRCVGAWLSLVERSFRVREVASSNLAAPTFPRCGREGDAGVSHSRQVGARKPGGVSSG